MNSVIVEYQNNLITRVWAYSEEILKYLKSNKVPHKIFEQGFCGKEGDSIEAYNNEGNKYPLSVLYTKGLIELKDNEKIENEMIVELTELEMFKKNPSANPAKKIEKDPEGNEYVGEKTIEEKYKEGLVGKEEYNEHILSIRTNEYSKLDGDQAEARRLYDLGMISEEEYKTKLTHIHNNILSIKEKHQKAI